VPVFGARDLLVLAAWVVVGLVAAGVRFRWEPYRPAQHRPAQQHHRERLAGQSG
jgi:hypothetical protein